MEDIPQKRTERLPKDEAQEEAGMLRAQMGMSPESGKLEHGREATAEDYDRALADLEELRLLAEQESSARKVFAALGRLSINAAMLGVDLKEYFSPPAPEWHDSRYWGTDEERAAATEDAKRRQLKDSNFNDRLRSKLDALRAVVEDESFKLRKLKSGGERFDKAE